MVVALIRRHLWTLCSAAAVVLLAVALLNPTGGPAPAPAVLVLDRSASIDAGMNAAELRWTAHATGAVVGFAADAQSLPADPAVVRARTPAGPDAEDTDIADGLRAALASTPVNGRVIVVTDGQQTAGDALSQIAAARLRGVHVDAALLGRRVVDAAVSRIAAPADVHQGDTIALTVTVDATARVPGQLTVRRDDAAKPDSQVIQMRDGETPYTLSYTATTPGWHSFTVAVHLHGDEVPQNDALSVAVHVGPPPRVAVVTAGRASAVAPILSARGARVQTLAPAALPATAAGYAALDALVLEDLPADELSPAQLAALDGAVRTGGLGVLALGGPSSYSLGGYARSPLQRILPVTSLVPGDLQRRNVALELVLDRSGSMADLSAGVPKIQMAQRAARQTLAFVAHHRDELGITDFDIAPHTLVPMQRVAPGARELAVGRRIDSLQADGGTDIYLALRSGLADILKSSAHNRHMILLTDGISQPHDYRALLQQFAAHHVSVATVALGTDVDAPLLRAIAQATGGNFYQTSDARKLPRIFIKETRLSAKPVQVRGDLSVSVAASAPAIRSLAGREIPGVTGNVITQLRPGAQADLVAHGGTATAAPALAQWQYGTGRVIAWTPGLGPPWGTAWLREPAVWNDAVRWAARADTPPPPVTVRSGAGTSLTLDLTGLGGAAAAVIPGRISTDTGTRRVSFTATSPGIYTAVTRPPLTPGIHALTLGLPGASASRLVAVPYPAEFLPPRPGAGVLGQVVTETGGRFLGPADYGAIGGGGSSPWRWPVAAALVLFAAGVAGRMLPRRRQV